MIKLLIITAVSFFQPQAQDSLGVETINGKLFVVHKVGPKETLYAISKRYNTTVDAIVQQNPEVSSGLDIGQIIKVPYTKPVVAPAVTTGKGGLIHVVAAKETLYSISRAYNISVDELKQWNNITDNSLSLGQELVIKKRNTITTTTVIAETPEVQNNNVPKGYHQVEAKETLFSIASKYSISVQQLRTWNALEGNELKIGQQLRVTAPQQEPAQQQVTPKEEPKDRPTEQVIAPTVTTSTAPKETTTTQPTTIRISESKNSDEISESGVAELIEGTEGNRKYLALHRTAPVGTILKVRNEMNNREVFVRVMGKLPDNAMSDKVLIRISKSAFDRLGAIDSRFRVQVTYYKQ